MITNMEGSTIARLELLTTAIAKCSNFMCYEMEDCEDVTYAPTWDNRERCEAILRSPLSTTPLYF